MVKSYISAIKAMLHMNNIKISEDQYKLASLVKACKIKNDCIRTRLPIRKGMLALLLKQANKVYAKQPYLALLYRTLLSTMYFGLFRIGELTAGPHQLLARDVWIADNKKKFLFALRSSKTHDRNVGPQLIKISSTSCGKGNNNTRKVKLPCPYRLLRQYSKKRGGYYRGCEPFFTFSDGSPVKPSHLNHCLKTVIKKAGFNPRVYSSHSLRSGRSCDLFKLGVSVESIKKVGRWKSNAVYRYLNVFHVSLQMVSRRSMIFVSSATLF